jgi:[ribosomal protein S5]-alanine N-acetyltransferase
VGGVGGSEVGRVFANLPELETERLLLRKMRLGDAEAMFAHATDPEVTRYGLWDTHRSIEDSEGFLRHAAEGYERGTSAAGG